MRPVSNRPAHRSSRLSSFHQEEKVIFMSRFILLLVPVLMADSVFADGPSEPSEPMYSIELSGPQVNLETSCDDPCHIDEVEVVGSVGMQASKTESEGGYAEDETAANASCYGECKKKKTQLRVSGPRTLKEGIEVSIEDRWAHFIIYSVTDTEKGPATRRQHYEFRVDRPLIEVPLDQHRLKLRSAVAQDADVLRK
jgi:hypothetical protein